MFENPLGRKPFSVESDGLGNLWRLSSEKRTEADMKRGANVLLQFCVGRTGLAEAGQGELDASEDAFLGIAKRTIEIKKDVQSRTLIRSSNVRVERAPRSEATRVPGSDADGRSARTRCSSKPLRGSVFYAP